MRRFSLLVACLIGSLIACVLGLAAGMMYNTCLVAWIGAGALPTACVYVAGLRVRSQLVKIASYSLFGWVLCFVLAPATSQRAESRAHRIAVDPLLGKGWYIPCAAASWLMASVGVAFDSNVRRPQSEVRIDDN